ALIAGAGTPAELAELAQRSLRRKRPALAEALTGRVTAHHRFLLAQLLRHIEFLDEAIATCDGRIATCTAAEADAVARLDTIPGVARRTAETIVAELGCDVMRFPTAGHAASWAGLCPGNHESADKRLRGRTRFANRVLRQALVESARGAVFKRDSYLAAQYRRLVKRRGDKKAIVAVAHSILVIAYRRPEENPNPIYVGSSKHYVAAPCQQACPTEALIHNEFADVYIQPDICNECAYCVARPWSGFRMPAGSDAASAVTARR